MSIHSTDAEKDISSKTSEPSPILQQQQHVGGEPIAEVGITSNGNNLPLLDDGNNINNNNNHTTTNVNNLSSVSIHRSNVQFPRNVPLLLQPPQNVPLPLQPPSNSFQTPIRNLRSVRGSTRINKASIRRLARRGGVKRMVGLMYEETRCVLTNYLTDVIRDAVTYTVHANRKTITATDVVRALGHQGKTLYGF